MFRFILPMLVGIMIMIFVFYILNTIVFIRDKKALLGARNQFDIMYYTIGIQSTLGTDIKPHTDEAKLVSMAHMITTMVLLGAVAAS